MAFILSSCDQENKTVIVAGDSWAQFVCVYKSLDTALKKQNINNAKTNSTCPATTRIGMHADNWLSSNYDKATELALLDPTVKVLYLSIGGNDVLSSWNKNLTPQEEDVIFNKIVSDVNKIIEKYAKQRPDVKILLSGYDFPRFTEDNAIEEYKNMYFQMGQPKALEINSAIVKFSNMMADAIKTPNVFYIQHYGLMHYYFGNSGSGLAAGVTSSPDLISSPSNIKQIGGDKNLLTDAKAMMTIDSSGVVLGDAFHLSKTGYSYLADHTVFHYLKNWLEAKENKN
tara:strand:- start:50812 stop:51666 length:855 start_codon:yes stop_codon:yes gene_type:complete